MSPIARWRDTNSPHSHPNKLEPVAPENDQRASPVRKFDSNSWDPRHPLNEESYPNPDSNRSYKNIPWLLTVRLPELELLTPNSNSANLYLCDAECRQKGRLSASTYVRDEIMARISYIAPDEISDPEVRGWLEESIERGRPGPENQAIRAHQPDVMRAFTLTRKLLFNKKTDAGVVETDLKELTRFYIARSLNCEY